VSFTLKIISRIKKELCIDSKRIYVTGYSNGAFMSYELALRHPELFAAIAPNAGSVHLGYYE
jgi:polyhydroxybutyrate depolymerase